MCSLLSHAATFYDTLSFSHRNFSTNTFRACIRAQIIIFLCAFRFVVTLLLLLLWVCNWWVHFNLHSKCSFKSFFSLSCCTHSFICLAQCCASACLARENHEWMQMLLHADFHVCTFSSFFSERFAHSTAANWEYEIRYSVEKWIYFHFITYWIELKIGLISITHTMDKVTGRMISFKREQLRTHFSAFPVDWRDLTIQIEMVNTFESAEGWPSRSNDAMHNFATESVWKITIIELAKRRPHSRSGKIKKFIYLDSQQEIRLSSNAIQ